MTLPLIYLLAQSDRKAKRRIINTIKNHNTDPNRVSELIREVINGGGIEYARQKMQNYRDEALEILDTFNPSLARQSMADLVNFTIERDK